MIFLDNVTILRRSTRPGEIATPILQNVSTLFKPRERIGILAGPSSGKSTIARMLCGIEPPDLGRCTAQGRVSWPIGSAGFLHPELTLYQNVLVIAKSINADPSWMMAFAHSVHPCLSDPGREMKDLSPVERSIFAFSVSAAVPMDYYIADEKFGVGDGEMRKKTEQILEYRLRRAGLIYLARNPNSLQKACTKLMVLVNGQLIPVPSIDIAKAMAEEWAEREAGMAESEELQPEQEV